MLLRCEVTTAPVAPDLAAEEGSLLHHAVDVERTAVGWQMVALLDERHAQPTEHEAIGGGGTSRTGADDDGIILIGAHGSILRDTFYAARRCCEARGLVAAVNAAHIGGMQQLRASKPLRSAHGEEQLGAAEHAEQRRGQINPEILPVHAGSRGGEGACRV